MKGETFASYIRKNTNTNTNTLPDSDLILYANIAKDEIAQSINKDVNEDYFQMTLYRNLVADQRDYSFHQDILRNLKRISAKLDGSEWQVLWEIDITQIEDPLVTDENVQNEFSDKSPAIDIQGRGFRILSDDSIIDVANGLQIEAMIYPSDITTTEISGTRKDADLSIPATNKEHAIPRAIHKVWALDTSIAYKNARVKPLPLNAEEQQVEAYRQRALNQLKVRNLDRSVQPTMPKNNGLDY